MLLLDHTPRLEPADAVALAAKLYGLTATVSTLPSERDQNFLLQTTSGERFILKIANALEDRLLLEAQNEVLAHLAGLSLCPRVVPAVDGKEISEISSAAGARNFVRLLTYLPGIPLAKIRPQSPDLLIDLGRRL